MIDNDVYMRGIYSNDFGMSGVPRPPRRKSPSDLIYSGDGELVTPKGRKISVKSGKYARSGRAGRFAWRVMRLVGPAIAGTSAFMFVLAGS